MSKTNNGLVEYAKAQLGLPYWYGTFGNTADEHLYKYKKKQYPKYYNPWSDFPTQYGKRVHDCVGLIKGYLWSDSAVSAPKYNGAQDHTADDYRARCKEKGSIDTMPDIPGVLVFSSGHVGVYIGSGYVIEARGHEYGVVKTKLKNRPWKWWGKCPYIDYEDGIKKYRLTVKNGTWNVRSGVGTAYGIVSVVKDGQEFSSSKTAGGWYYIDSIGGWISGKGVMLSDNR
ncbi:MAG: C40 family peptidase [Oscillospiraceae bacterium]|nr:C40 family peptidase [Oscillospiraceae bacterium]